MQPFFWPERRFLVARAFGRPSTRTGLSLALLLGVLLGWAGCAPPPPDEHAPRKIEVLFLGHDSRHHDSATYAPLLASALSREGINLSYTDDPNDLNPETLARYDALLIYANHDSITAAQEQALLGFVRSGKGFLPIHAASYCFRNSPDYVALVGAQFKSHETGTFTAEIVDSSHAVLQGLEPFETWDETYVHDRHNPDRTVLMERVEGDHREPWTWTRTYGEGRVFYTAYGHDERTWSHPGFQALLKNAVLWAVGDEVHARWAELPRMKHVYVDHDSIPNYERRTPPPRFQLPFSPESSQDYIQVPPEFELQLFAAEPDIVNPIAMAWDERGRLWVLETYDYPNQPRPEGQGRDVLKIFEDTNGDGRADRHTVFADSLNIPTSLTFANDGVIVAQAPHFLFLKDTDGDDRADVREVLITGWGVEDTHAGPSNLKYGFDNWIWGTVGYSDFEGTVGGRNHELSQGVYRFTPDGQRLDPVAWFTNNTWGLGFSETFDLFGSTANNEHSVFIGIPLRYYERVEGLEPRGSFKIDGHYAMRPNTLNFRQVDVWGGFTAAAGFNLYTARSFPRDYWNRIALVSEPTGHLLHRAVLEPQGAGFAERDGWNLLASADEWVSPVHAEVGPDGAVWVLDWYNFIVQHNPTPEGYRTGAGNAHVNPLRDQQHGRIYRIVYRDAPPYRPLELSKERPDQLVETLTHDNLFWRLTAQRLLVERGERDVVPALYRLIRVQTRDALGLNPGALHALWTLHGLGVFSGSNEEALQVARGALQHPAAGVRKAAAQVLPRTDASLHAILEANLIDDPDPHTRLAVLLAVSEMPASAEAGARLYAASTDSTLVKDPWLAEALYIAAAAHREGFFDAYAADQGGLAFVRQASRIARGEDDYLATRARPGFDDAGWDTMSVPLPWSQTELADFNGLVWYRTAFDVPAGLAGRAARLHLGPVYEYDIAWINGTRVSPQAPGAWWQERDYPVPEGLLEAGSNLLAVRVEDTRGDGGFRGEPDQHYLDIDGRRIPLAGAWKYAPELAYAPGKPAQVRAGVPIAAQLLAAYIDEVLTLSPARPAPTPAPEAGVNVELTVSVVVGALEYAQTELTVRAGQRVRLVLDNPDDMQHNLLLLRPGTTEAVGALADEMAAQPDAAARQYVPDSPDILAATDLADPRSSVTLVFTAPEEPGDYPYICTFPGHWRIMQGVLHVLP